MTQNVFFGEAAGGRIVKLEAGTVDIEAVRGGTQLAALAEDTFAAGANTNLPNWTPSTTKAVSIGFGGYTFNLNGSAPANPFNWKVYTNSTTGNDHSASPFRARCNTDIADNNFRLYASLGRDGVDVGGAVCGVRVLVDGSDNQDTEKDGIDIVFERASASTANLRVYEYLDGVLSGSKTFYASAGNALWSWGLGKLNWGMYVEVSGSTLTIHLGDVMTDGTYTLANEVTLYSGGVPDNTYTIVDNRTGKKRIGMVSGANPSSGKGRIGHMYVEDTSTPAPLPDDEVVGPDLLWRSKPYSPAGEAAHHSFRRLVFFIKHNAGFEFLIIPFVNGRELFTEDGVSQRQTITNRKVPSREVVEAVEVPVNGEGQNISWTLRTAAIRGNFYVEGVLVGYQADRAQELHSQAS